MYTRFHLCLPLLLNYNWIIIKQLSYLVCYSYLNIKFLRTFIWFRSLMGFFFLFLVLHFVEVHRTLWVAITVGLNVWRYQKSGSLIIQIFIVIALSIVHLIKDIMKVQGSQKWPRQKNALLTTSACMLLLIAKTLYGYFIVKP